MSDSGPMATGRLPVLIRSPPCCGDKGVYVRYPCIVLWGVVTLFLLLGLAVTLYFIIPRLTTRSDDVTSDVCTDAWSCIKRLMNGSNDGAEALVADRLPVTVRPIHYNIELRPDIYLTTPDQFTLAGNVEIFLKCESATDTIYVHSKDLNIDPFDVALVDNRGVILPTSMQLFEGKNWFKVALFHESLLPGDYVTLNIGFRRMLSNHTEGLFWISYQESNATKYMVASQLQPNLARQVFPCLDEPRFKATYNVSLWRMAPMLALSNMPLVDTETKSDGWFLDRFAQTSVVMSTYLLAFIVADYGSVTDGNQTAPVMRYWAPRDQVPHLHYARSKGRAMLTYLEGYFALPYPLPKIDMVALPRYRSWGMENWGLIVYRTNRLVWDPQHMAVTDKYHLASTVAHELVHMWLGNMVTCVWWDHIWLHEGFARYYQHRVLAEVEPTWDMEQLFVAHTTYRALIEDSDSGVYSLPVFFPVLRDSDIRYMFSTSTYDKAACIIRMLREAMGHSAFDRGMRSYVHNFTYKSVHYRDLYNALSQEVATVGYDQNIPLSEFLNTWIKQEGYPVLTFTRRTDSAHISVTQRRFLFYPYVSTSASFDYSWHVPFTYTTSKELDWYRPRTRWLYRDNVTFELHTPLEPSDWLLGNVRSLGFFRVNYDPMNWDALIGQLNEDYTVFHVINRAALIDDAMSLAWAGHLPHVTALGVIEYLASEVEYLPFQALRPHMQKLDLLLQNHPLYTHFRTFARRLFGQNYRDLGWNGANGENMLTTEIRHYVVEQACHYGLDGCEQEASLRFQRYRQHPQDLASLDPAIRKIVYCNGVKLGTDDDWEFLWRRLLETTRESEVGWITQALACTDKIWLLSKYSAHVMECLTASSNLPCAGMISALVQNPAARPLLWRLLNDHVDDIDVLYGRLIVDKLLALSYTIYDIQQVREFLPKVGEAEDSYFSVNVMGQMNSTKHWADHNIEEIVTWISEKVS